MKQSHLSARLKLAPNFYSSTTQSMDKAALKPDEIEHSITAMQELVTRDPPLQERELKRKFAPLLSRYPALFAKASKPMSPQDAAILSNMLAQMRAISTRNADLHDSSVNVGQDLVDRFVKPRLSTPE